MAHLKNIFIHHSGGIGDDPYASSAHLKAADIEAYHKQKWNYPGALNRFGGYNLSIDPKMAAFYQHRAIGEETIAQRGNNFDSLSICIIGNYNIDPKTGQTVDKMEVGVVQLLEDIILTAFKGVEPLRQMGMVVKPGTTVSFDVSRIYPHRFVSSTDCYGRGLADNWARDLIVRAMARPDSPTAISMEEYEELQRENTLLKMLVQLYVKIMDLHQLPKLKANAEHFAQVGALDQECDGFIH